MPRLTSEQARPIVEARLLPEDVSKMTDEELDAAIDRLRGARFSDSAGAAGKGRGKSATKSQEPIEFDPTAIG